MAAFVIVHVSAHTFINVAEGEGVKAVKLKEMSRIRQAICVFTGLHAFK